MRRCRACNETLKVRYKPVYYPLLGIAYKCNKCKYITVFDKKGESVIYELSQLQQKDDEEIKHLIKKYEQI